MKSILPILLVMILYGTAYSQNPDIEGKIDALLSKMTLREKIGQLNQLDGRGVHGTVTELKALISKGGVGSLMNITDPEVVNELQKVAVEQSPNKIPLIFTRDVVHGFKTMLPIPLGMAASFDPGLIREGSRMAAIEATEHGIRWAFAPMIDIARDARWGRIAESFGEDTYLTSKMAEAVVKGYQTDDLSGPQSMAACLKHFAAYGAAEGGRDYNSTFIPERQLREVYLPPFQKGIEAGAASIMTSFNDNDGIPASGNKFLLKNILREEWAFDGVVLSDWGSVTEMIKHGFAENRKQAAQMAINAGVDVEMSSQSYIENLRNLIAEQAVSEATLNTAVRNILRLKFRLGLFDHPFTNVKQQKHTYSDQHLSLAKKITEESIVLLKNEDNMLPFSNKVRSILVTGPLADAPHDQMGTWTMDGETGKVQTPAKAIAAMYGDQVKVHYLPGLAYSRDKDTSKFAKLLALATSVDAIVAFVGEEAILTGEAHSLANLNLQGAQSQLIRNLHKTGTPLITVVMAGRPLTIGKEAELSDALFYAWHPGTMGGPAIADMLFGKAVPAGKLPLTFPKEAGQIPIYYNHTRTGRPASNKEKSLQDIPLNAKQSVLGHSSYYLDIGSKPLYPFGYGLSYTTFEYSNLKVSQPVLSQKDTLQLQVDIENTGQNRGVEIAQLYISDVLASVTRPVKELKDFKKVELEKGEKRRLAFRIPISELAFWNIDMEHVVEPGKFKLMIGTNNQTGLETYIEVK